MLSHLTVLCYASAGRPLRVAVRRFLCLEEMGMAGEDRSRREEKGVQVMDADDMRRALTRIAHEIVEKNHGAAEIALVGILLRGVPVAERLAHLLQQIENVQVPVGRLDIGLYRDDFAAHPTERPALAPSTIPFDVSDKRIVLV